MCISNANFFRGYPSAISLQTQFVLYQFIFKNIFYIKALVHFMRPLWQMQFSNSWPRFAVFQIFLLRICLTLKTYAFQNSELVTQWSFFGKMVNYQIPSTYLNVKLEVGSTLLQVNFLLVKWPNQSFSADVTTAKLFLQRNFMSILEQFQTSLVS